MVDCNEKLNVLVSHSYNNFVFASVTKRKQDNLKFNQSTVMSFIYIIYIIQVSDTTGIKTVIVFMKSNYSYHYTENTF